MRPVVDDGIYVGETRHPGGVLKSMAQHLEQGDVVTITQYARNSCTTQRVLDAAESGLHPLRQSHAAIPGLA
ncbi:MAG TPA: hypothetical protein DCM53_05615 [Enterobacteriaceae bacterium]|nr:hypothetical protein [Enterobacteriaceae bacterium]